MLNVRRGDLVYLPIPNQEGGHGISVKLSIILENSHSLITVVPCTSQDQAWRYDKKIIVLKDSPEGKAMKLRWDSIIMIDRMDPFPERMIQSIHEGGKAPESLLKKIEDMLEE